MPHLGDRWAEAVSSSVGAAKQRWYSDDDSQKNNQEKYNIMILLEIDQSKLQELSSDEKIKFRTPILYTDNQYDSQ